MKNRKNIVCGLLLCVMLSSLFLCSCNGDNGKMQENNVNMSEENQQEQEERDEDVTVTIPSSYFEGNEEEIEKIKKLEGIRSLVINNDGTVTMVMTKERRSELRKELKEKINGESEKIQENSSVKSIKKVKFEDDFITARVTAESKEKYKDSEDNLYLLSLAHDMYCYNRYGGKTDTEVSIIVQTEDNEEIDRIVYPEK